MTDITPGTPQWLASVTEDIIDPDRRIIDPHHHLWRRPDGNDYVLADLWKDTGSGHHVVKTVFVECGAEYLKDGPDHLKPVGEVQFVAQQALASTNDPAQAEIAAIVGHANLTLVGQLPEVLSKLEAAGNGKFRGIRHAGSCARYPETLFIAGRAPEGLYQDKNFRAGMKVLGDAGFTYDTWHYHHQNQDFLALAQAVPDTQMILDHFGTPLGVGPFASQRAEIFEQWKLDIKEIAKCGNVVAKIGGLAMPDNGFGWHAAAKPPTSDEFVEAQRDYYLHTIECFGPDRCMFESNFPVDKFSLSYHVLYNGLKKIVADFSESEKDQMFYGTAARIYQI